MGSGTILAQWRLTGEMNGLFSGKLFLESMLESAPPPGGQEAKFGCSIQRDRIYPWSESSVNGEGEYDNKDYACSLECPSYNKDEHEGKDEEGNEDKKDEKDTKHENVNMRAKHEAGPAAEEFNKLL